MAQTNSKFFSVMVVGENPQEIMKKYDSSRKTEPHVKYKYLEAKKYQTTAIKVLEKLFDEADKIGMTPNVKETLEFRLKGLKKMTPFEYYQELTDGMYYDENGNALSEENPNGHWNTCRKGGNFSLPLITMDGNETYSARAKDVMWEKMHNNNQDVYRTAWEMVMEDKEPSNENEETIYKAMKDRTAYFSNFNSKEDYITYSTAYWNYAYVDEENGWQDMDNSTHGNEIEWVKNFYNNFVKKLKPNDLLTIFECTVNNG